MIRIDVFTQTLGAINKIVTVHYYLSLLVFMIVCNSRYTIWTKSNHSAVYCIYSEVCNLLQLKLVIYMEVKL